MLSKPSRRALIGGAGLAAVLVASPVVASATPPLSNIEQQWQSRCQAFLVLANDPDDDEEKVAWDRIDAAEVAILHSPDNSTQATELRLWVAWSHADMSRVAGPVSRLVSQGDVPALLSIQPDLDWHEKLLFAAILNLRGEA